MESVAGFVTAVSLAMIIAGIFSMLTPRSSTKKVFNMALCVFLLLTVLIPMSSGLDIEFDIPEVKTEEEAENAQRISETLMAQLEQTASLRIKEQAEEVLFAEEIYPAKIRIIMDRTVDGRIQISQVEILVHEKDSHKTSRIESLIEQNLGIAAYAYPIAE